MNSSTNSTEDYVSTKNDTNNTSSLYNSALEHLTSFSIEESANNNTTTHQNNSVILTNSTDFDLTLHDSQTLNHMDLNNAKNMSMMFIQSESNETNNSEEVDPKSQLANKTIFKTDNPNLSIIEINNSSIKDNDTEHSVYLIEPLSDDDGDGANTNTLIASTPTSADAEMKRRKKVDSFLHSSIRKLNLDKSIEVEPFTGSSHENCLLESNGNTPIVASKKRDTIKVYDTIEEFENNLPETVTILTTPFGSKVYLVGTAHFSEESQDDVSYVIRNVRPDVVMVELCPSRIHILKLDEKTLLEEVKNFNLSKIRSIIQTNGYINGIFFILLLHMGAQIAKELGMAPGGEFRRAFQEIHKIPGCLLHLGDRPIRITLQRALRALSLWQTVKLVWRLTSTESISIEEVEECKKRDLLEKLMQEMAGEFPAFSDVFVKERDLFLCHSLQLAALPLQTEAIPRPVRVVGVVGIGHADGIAKNWGLVDPNKIPLICEVPPASTSTRICTFTLKYGLIGLTLFGVFKFVRPRLQRFF